tara:strand:- start:3974 stop:4801 length:828 start_codon:yes stop_codon:yes gene_type:complete
MKVLSIDIGIKNLAFALIEHNENCCEHEILKWDIINLCNSIPNCSNPKCNAKAKFYKNKSFFCKKHTKNEEFKIPNINIKTLAKQNIKSLNNIIEENNIKCDLALELNKKLNKQDMIKVIEDHVENNCFNIIETINANNINLIDIGINLKCECNKIFDTQTIESIDMIIIENQISPIANRMKTIQGMVAQYFIDRGNYNIEFISAANKLKLFIENKKTSYSERKKLSINFTNDILNKKNKIKEYDFFVKHAKKDDLADCYLQAIYYLHSFNKFKL